MSAQPKSEEELFLLKQQKEKKKRRQRSTQVAARALAAWLDPNVALDEKTLSLAANRWLAKLGEENTRRLTMRMRRMADWELLRAEKMRDKGASPWMLLKYVGASQDMVIDGPACRDAIYKDLMQHAVARQREKSREALLKVAIPLAVVATVSVIATAGIGFIASAVGPSVGIDPGLAGGIWESWKDLISPGLEKVKDVASDFDIASGGLMFGLGAFWMWAHDSRIAEDLRSKTAEREVPTLDSAIGFEVKGERIQSAIRLIPEADRILLAHFSSTDLRAFLLSTDEDRMHMLRENRPPLIAEFKAALAARDRSWAGLLPAIKDIADVCMPKKWARAIGAHHPGEISPEKMKVWRTPKLLSGALVAKRKEQAKEAFAIKQERKPQL